MVSASRTIPVQTAIGTGNARHVSSPWSVRPLLIPVLAVTFALGLVLRDVTHPNASWFAALAIGSFVLTLRGPFWVLVPVILTELTVFGYPIQSIGVAQRLIVLLLALIIATPSILRSGFLTNSWTLRVLIPSGLFVVFATIGNLMFSGDAYVFEYFRYQVGQIIALLLAATLIRNRHDLKRIALIALAIGVAAAIAAVWQHYAASSAPFGVASAEDVRGWKGRVMGFSGSPVALATQMNFLILPVAGVLLTGSWRLNRRVVMTGFAFLILFAALNFSYTRSSLFAIGPGLLLMGLFLPGKRRLIVVGSVIAAVFAFQALEGTGLIGHRYYQDASEDTSAASHEVLWDVSMSIAMDNPLLGIGHEHFEEVSQSYVNDVQLSDVGPSGIGVIGKQRPHNDFLSVWLSWGILALIVYIAIFIGTLRNLATASRSPDVLVRGLAIGCAGGVAVYAVNSAFHNSLDSSVFLWLFAGVSVALARMTVNARRHETARPVSATDVSSTA